jgi:uncharacterized protein YecT (DUF1311 family)
MSRGLLIVGLAVLGHLPWSAQAADTRQPNIKACIDAAQTSDAMRLCKRIVFKPCVKEPENMDSTMGLVMCNEREGMAWGDLLTMRTAEMKTRHPHRADALEVANKAWRAWIDAECNYHRSDAMGGSAEAVITTECKSDQTAERVIQLTLQLRGNTPY